MKPSEYFERYGRGCNLEIFRGEDLPAGAPDLPGMYAWYGRVVVPEPDRLRAEEPEGAVAVLKAQVFDRFQRQPYDVTMKAALEPRFHGRLSHISKDLTNLRHGASRRPFWDFLAQSFAPMFAVPLYVGKAVQQTVASRISQHLDRLRDYSSRNSEFLAEQRQWLTSVDLPSDEDRDSHSFALEAAARRFSPERLILVTFAPPVSAGTDLDILESVVNHVTFPVCGRR
jgi:hypothetical protein